MHDYNLVESDGIIIGPQSTVSNRESYSRSPEFCIMQTLRANSGS